MAPHVPAPMDPQQTEEMNLRVMTRIDPATEEILAAVGHVALYEFNTSGQTWTRKDVEGSLFLQRRRTAPIHQFTVLNKKSQCNYTEEVSNAMAFELQNEKYILYRNVHEQVLCMWFHSPDDCAKVANLLQRMTSVDLAQARKTQPSPAQPGGSSAKSAPAAASTTANGSRNGRDDSFWDQASSTMQAKELQSTEAALDGSSGSGAGGSNGPLHKLFSNIKLAPGVTPQHSQQQQQQPQQPPTQQPPTPAVPLPQRNTAMTPQRQQRGAGAGGSQAAQRAASGGLSISPPSPAPAGLLRGMSGSAATPGKGGPPLKPQLLTPSFFKQSAQSAPQRESAGAVSPLPLSLGAPSAGQRSGGTGAASGATATLSALAADPQQRQAVRRTMLALADQEPFLDMVAAALQQAGYKL